MSVTDLQREHLRELVVALRSGTYQQGHLRLCLIGEDGSPRYCCLGVACQISGLGTWEEATWEGIVDTDVDTDAYRRYTVGSDTDCNYLPYAVEQYFGLDRAGTLPRSVHGRKTLTFLNDDRGYTFEQIADIIEEQFLL